MPKLGVLNYQHPLPSKGSISTINDIICTPLFSKMYIVCADLCGKMYSICVDVMYKDE